LLCGLSKGFAGLELAKSLFGAELQIPIFGNVFGATEAAQLRAFAPLLAVEVCGAVPVTAVRTAVEADLVT
jgi:hypothetical protein|tara:strand:- start:1136 stop:1348 length:213 start_codon:yes stop_codon:yes gene_type:complete